MSLEARNLELHRGERILQSGLCLDVQAGEALWVQGPNGVGKSTLLETLCGFYPQMRGEISWRGHSIDQHRDEYHAELGFLGHKNGNNPNLTARAALAFYDALLQKDQADDALKIVGLEKRSDIAVRALSAGQQKRLTLARIILSKATLWVLDEPSTSLDQAGVELLQSLVQDHLAAGGMAVYTSHVPLEIAAKTLTLEPMSHDAQRRDDAFLGAEWEGVA